MGGTYLGKEVVLVFRLVLAVIIIINGQNFVLHPTLNTLLNYGTWPRLLGIYAFCLSFVWDVEGGAISMKEIVMAAVATLLLTTLIQPAPDVQIIGRTNYQSFW